MSSRNAMPASMLDLALLRRLAGARSFARGERYFAGGLVGAVNELDGVITAKVKGTRTYRVRLWLDADTLAHKCECPIGQQGGFCKHAVALGLAWLDAGAAKPSGKAGAKPRAKTTLEDVRAHLLKQDRPTLVEIIMQQATGDDGLRRRLMLQMASDAAGTPDPGSWRDVIDEAVDVDGFVDYRDMSAYLHGIDAMIDGLDNLLGQGHASDVIELAEYALAAVENASGPVDDSDGGMSEAMERIQTLHLRACTRAKPDPELLARRLFAWELRSEWDSFLGAAQTYATLLGKKGLALYRRLAEAEWAKMPALHPGNRAAGTRSDRFRITHIMQTLAQQAGDIEAMVAIMQRDLSLPYHYLQIAELYQAQNRHDAALDWAERGIKAFPTHHDTRLLEFLADIYHQRDRHTDAMALIWAAFSEHTYLESYRGLLDHARRSGQHDAWRERALAHIREVLAIGRKPGAATRWSRDSEDHSLLVSIFLWEKDADSAWREAQLGGCSNPLWLMLAAARAESHPRDALGIYLRQLEPLLDQTSNQAYQEAISYLGRIRSLFGALGRGSEFEALLAGLRLTWKRKRNFIKLLDATNW